MGLFYKTTKELLEIEYLNYARTCDLNTLTLDCANSRYYGTYIIIWSSTESGLSFRLNCIYSYSLSLDYFGIDWSQYSNKCNSYAVTGCVGVFSSGYILKF